MPNLPSKKATTKQKPEAHKPRVERLSRARKKQQKKERPAGSPSSVAEAGRNTTPEHVSVNAKPHKVKANAETKRAANISKVQKIREEQLLAKVAKRYQHSEKKSYTLAREDRDGYKARALAAVSDSFVKSLGKHKGYTRTRLMESVIDYVRLDQPKAEPPKKDDAKVKKEKRLTDRQLKQVAKDRARAKAQKEAQVHAAAPQPAVSTVTAKTRRGAPKATLSQKKCNDSQVVLAELDKLFQADTLLKRVFCEASAAEVEQLLHTNKHLQQLAIRLKSQLRFPRSLNSLLYAAIDALLPKYREQQREADRQAALRREEEKTASATAARELRQKQLQKDEFDARYPHIREHSLA